MTTLHTVYISPRDHMVRRAAVEVVIQPGIGIHLVGLADSAVKESLLRTVTALQSCGYTFPGKKVIINITPSNHEKSVSGFDLPIALGILLESGQVNFDASSLVFHGELSLDGTIRKTGEERSIIGYYKLPGAFVCGRLSSDDEEYEYNGDHYPFRDLPELIEYAEKEWRD